MAERLIQFHIHYRAEPDERLFINFHNNEDNRVHQLFMLSFDHQHWTVVYPFKSGENIQYCYGLKKKDGSYITERFGSRELQGILHGKNIFVNDFWRSKDRVDSIFFSSAFKDIIFKREFKELEKIGGKKSVVTLNLHTSDIGKKYTLAVVGNQPLLGDWSIPQMLSPLTSTTWSVQFEIPKGEIDYEYKYVLCDINTRHIVQWEQGPNRRLTITLPTLTDSQLIQNDEVFRKARPEWRGAGVAIPVFSLRSKKGLGIGEFLDLKLMIDFASASGMSMVQILPVNDTIANKTWQDSYPYSAISVFALHPMYINVASVAKFKKQKDQKEYDTGVSEMNNSDQIDFELVIRKKFHFLKILFVENFENLQNEASFKSFKEQNDHWLTAYAVFCALRDKYETPDFNQWPDHKCYDEKSINSLLLIDQNILEETQFFIFLQYHAHLQLKAANEYGKQKGVVLKGDLPIGIYRHSCDAWIAPHQYNMEEQAGAPPDAYAVLGQNWGFPTYNWSEMSKDNFLWWQKRMIKLSEYFDALRIDHILGFFRIWQIPFDHVQGTMGMFNPRKPFRRDELMHFGIYGDLTHFTNPYIRYDYLQRIFGSDTHFIIELFLTSNFEGSYVFRKEFPNQKAISSFIHNQDDERIIKYRDNILSLMSEVLLIEEPGSNGTAFNPRITLQTTNLYQSLDDQTKRNFDKLYIDYYYHRHNEFWKSQALWKLPALLDATNIFICGEDLGMIPSSVPEVMEELQIVPLEIQRMPKGPTPFGIPKAYPYFSVCSPSCHDMSTIRGWWEGNKDVAQKFYNQYMGRFGKAPQQISMEVINLILDDHFHSTSMLAIFPIQDLLAIDEELRRPDPFAEQINEPSNPNHYWRYRLHLPLEDLLKQTGFIQKLKEKVVASKRSN